MRRQADGIRGLTLARADMRCSIFSAKCDPTADMLPACLTSGEVIDEAAPSTAFTTPDAVKKCVFEVFDLEHGRRPHDVKLVAALDPKARLTG